MPQQDSDTTRCLTASQDTSAPSVDRREQVARQCDAVRHLATALSNVCEDYANMLRAGAPLPLEIVGNRTANQMEILGDMINGIDAVTEEDAWLEPIFEEAHRLWPQPTPCAWCGSVELKAEPPTGLVEPSERSNTDAAQEKPWVPELHTCPKCGATAAAFICDEPGCPVNSGAAYGHRPSAPQSAES